MENMEQAYQDRLKWLETEPLLKNLSGDVMEPMVWYRRKLDGCINAGGSENWMYLKKGTTNNLVIFFIGGGFAYTAEMAKHPGSMRDFFIPAQELPFYTDECHPNNEYYYFHIMGNQGIFSLDPDNRFAEWSIAMFNYGTADMHIGNGDHRYTCEDGNTVLLHHHGYQNFQAGLDVVHCLFPKPEKILVTGCSAGGFAVPALAADIAERYASCEDITICPDSASLWSDSWSTIVHNIWNAPDHIAKWSVSDNFVLDMFHMAQARIGNRAKYLFICGYPDGVLATFQSYMDTGDFSLSKQAEKTMRKNLNHQIDTKT